MLSEDYSGGDWSDGNLSFYNAIAQSPSEDAIFAGGGLQSSALTGTTDPVSVITKISTDTNTQVWSRTYEFNYQYVISALALTDTSSDYKLVAVATWQSSCGSSDPQHYEST